MAGGTSPCASCKLLRRRCAKDCIFAPYFPPDDPLKFSMVHKVFGASNVNKMLQELPIQKRGDAVNSLVYEANARARDPVYGCVGAISYLQNQVSQLQMQLAVAQAELLCIQMEQEQQQQQQQQTTTTTGLLPLPMAPMAMHPSMMMNDHDEMDVPDEKSLLLQQYLSFGSAPPVSTTHHVIQDPPKREFLWA